MRPLIVLGPIMLFLAAAVYGVLEVHSSTDTWIGLAAGRQIFESPTFPRTDTFSYTFYGSTWYNQNWLTHVWLYWLYSRFGPNAVVYGTWAMAASIFALVMLAAYWKTGRWVWAACAAAVVAYGSRDFLSARPATTGFFLMAVGLALICALEAPRRRRWELNRHDAPSRDTWWPIALMLPLLLVWGNAHGSFVFGYGIIGLYLVHWFAGWLVAKAAGERSPERHGWLNISPRQVIAIGGVMVAAFLLTWILGPFGFDNFTHGEKIRGSSIFRQVSEWKSPFVDAPFPPVHRVRTVVQIAVGSLLLAAALGGWYGLRRVLRTGESPAPARKNPPHPAGKTATATTPRLAGLAWMFRSMLLYDLAMIGIGIGMTIWARRFAPILFIFGAPALLSLILTMARPIAPRVKFWVAAGVGLAAWVWTYAIVIETKQSIQEELIDEFRDKLPNANLLERVTRYDSTPHDTIMYMLHNNIRANLLTEWTQAGPIMFYTPQVRVFMDGRAQQLYDEPTYRDLERMMGLPFGPNLSPPERARVAERVRGVLDSPSRAPYMPDRARTDAVLVRRSKTGSGLWQALDADPEWSSVYMGVDSILFLRKNSPAFTALAPRVLDGTEWRPRTATALTAKGNFLLSVQPRRVDEAIQSLRDAVELDFSVGLFCYPAISALLAERDGVAAAREFVQQERTRLQGSAGAKLKQPERDALFRNLEQCERDLIRRSWSAPASRPAATAPATSAPAETQPGQTADKENVPGGR